MSRRRIFLLAAAFAVVTLLVLLIARGRVQRRHVRPHEGTERTRAAEGVPPVEQWSGEFRARSGKDLREMLDAIEERHPDLYRRWQLAWLHARAFIEEGEEDDAAAKLVPFTRKGHPFRDLALHHRSTILEDGPASRDRMTLILEHRDSPWRDEAIDDEVAWRAGRKELGPLLDFATRIQPAASTRRRREISSRVVEAQMARGLVDPALTRALSLLRGGTGDDAADRAARAIDRPEVLRRLTAADLALLGEALQTHRHFDRAIAILNMAVVRTPGDELRFALGRSLFGDEQYEQAQTVYLRGANATREAKTKALFLWHAARAAQLRGDDDDAERLMTSAIAVKGTHPATTAALTQRIRTRVRQRRMPAAASDLALLRRIAPRDRASFEGSLAFAVGALAYGNPRACIAALDAVPRGVTREHDRAEIAYWRARALERTDPAAAVAGYLDIFRISTSTPYRRFARQRLATRALRPAVAQAQAVRDTQVANLLAAGRNELAIRIQTERVQLSGHDRATQLRRLASIYRRVPAYLDVLELKPAAVPGFPLRDPEPLDLLLAMGLYDDATAGVERRWGLHPQQAALTRSTLLNLGGASRASIFAIEVMMRPVPDDFLPELLPSLVRELLHPRYFESFVEAVAARHDADPALVLAIMREESRFDPRARSQAAARGLLQFIITTARDVGRSIGLVGLAPEDLYDPRVIISLGARYIGELAQRFDGNVPRIAASYNAGPNQTELWSRLQPAPGDDYFFAAVNFDETKDYVRKVTESHEEYAVGSRQEAGGRRQEDVGRAVASCQPPTANRQPLLGDHPLVQLPVPRHDLRLVEAGDGHFATAAAEALAERVVAQDLDRLRGHGVDVADLEQVAGLGVHHHLRQSAGARRDHRDLGGHGLEGGHAERLRLGGQQEEIARTEDLLEVRHVAEEEDAVAQIVLAAEGLGTGAVRAVADHQQAARHLLRHPREHLHDVHDPLHGTEVRHVAEQPVARAAEHHAEVAAVALETGRVDEVRDDVDRLPGVEVRRGLQPEPLGDGGDSVRHLDAELRDRQVAFVPADQRDVGSVQRGDHLQARMQDLLRQVSADGVRDGVVDVEDVEPLVCRHLRHLRRQGQRVRRVGVEQRVGGDGDLVEVDAFVEQVQPRRERVADEVDLVPVLRQREPELRRDHSRAAECGIAGDADAH